MEDLKKVKIPVSFQRYEVINETTSKVSIYICYAGANRNGSYFSKETLEDMIPTLYGCPVVGEYSETLENFRGHGGKIEITQDDIKFIETTKPYGFVDKSPEFANVRWEEVEDEEGNKKNYLVCDAYLWRRRYSELDVVFETGSNQSMEVIIEDGKFEDDNLFHITKGQFDALCILGKSDDPNINVEPCFEDSSIVAYSLDKETFKQEFSIMVEEIKNSLTQPAIISSEGGEKEVNVPSPVVFELSHDDIRAKIFDILNPRDEEGYRTWNYWIVSVFNDYVIVQDENSPEDYYKIPYTIGEDDSVTLGDKVQVFPMFLTQEEKDALDEMRTNYSTLEAEVQELREYKEAKEVAEYEAQQEKEKQEKIDYVNTEYECVPEEIRNQFIEKIDEYASTKDIDSDMCIYIVKNKLDFSKANIDTNTIKVGVDRQKQNIEFSPYGDLSYKFNKVN